MGVLIGILGIIMTAALAIGSVANHAKKGTKPPFIYLIFLVVLLGNSILNIAGGM